MKNKNKLIIRFFARAVIDLSLVLLCSLIVKPLSQSHFDSVFADSLEGETAVSLDAPVYPYTKTFTISAYYSPLPCQNRYVTGSYESDIRLNGRGVRGADGTGVYPGMVAAPRIYDFGTKMDIPGVGIVAVHDRGGAIVASNGQSGIYDRLDIWMGYGDIGLKRALNWGKRTVEVVVYGQNDGIVEQISLDGYSPEEANPNCGGSVIAEEVEASEHKTETVVTSTKVEPLKKVEEKAPLEKQIGYSLEQDLKFGSSGDGVRELQLELQKLNFYHGEITGYYGQFTEHAVFKFQQAQLLVGDKDSAGAGVFGPKTRDRMKEIAATRQFNTNLIAVNTENYEKRILARRKGIYIASELNFGMSGPEVAKLQRFLKQKGFFDGVLITEYFGPVTRDAVVKFQRQNKLITTGSEAKAGTVDTQTLELINILA